MKQKIISRVTGAFSKEYINERGGPLKTCPSQFVRNGPCAAPFVIAIWIWISVLWNNLKPGL